MSFAFDIHRVAQEVAYLIRLSGKKKMPYLKLLKLLYWADRESLRESGFPLTGDEPYAMEYGPVLSNIYNHIVPHAGYRPPRRECNVWNKYFERKGYDLVLQSDPGTGKLSRYDRRILESVHEKHQDTDGFDMSRLSHDFPEWKKNWYAPDKGARMSMHISLEDRLKALGMSSRVKAIREQAEEDQTFHKAFGT